MQRKYFSQPSPPDASPESSSVTLWLASGEGEKPPEQESSGVGCGNSVPVLPDLTGRQATTAADQLPSALLPSCGPPPAAWSESRGV